MAFSCLAWISCLGCVPLPDWLHGVWRNVGHCYLDFDFDSALLKASSTIPLPQHVLRENLDKIIPLEKREPLVVGRWLDWDPFTTHSANAGLLLLGSLEWIIPIVMNVTLLQFCKTVSAGRGRTRRQNSWFLKVIEWVSTESCSLGWNAFFRNNRFLRIFMFHNF